MRMKRDLHRHSPMLASDECGSFPAETAKTRMDAGDLKFPYRELHNSCVTGLCMSCTRLMNKKLATHEFH
jgi:hypothetical protein